MIITRKDLEKIEQTVGHSCEAGVLAGGGQGDIAIRVWAKQPDGQMFNCEHEFTAADHLNGSWEPELEQFRHWAKQQFDVAFTS